MRKEVVDIDVGEGEKVRRRRRRRKGFISRKLSDRTARKYCTFSL
jgi:hypothetical protein